MFSENSAVLLSKKNEFSAAKLFYELNLCRVKKLNIRGLPQNTSRYGHPHCFDFLAAASGRKHKPDCKSMRNVMQHASSKLHVTCVVSA